MLLPNKEQLRKIDLLKSFFFDLLTNEKNSYNFHSLIGDFIHGLKHQLQAKNVELYLYNKWKEVYILEQTTEEGKEKTEKHVVSKDKCLEIQNEHIIKEDKYVIPLQDFYKKNVQDQGFILLLKKPSDLSTIFGWLQITFEKAYIEEHKQELIDFLKEISLEASKFLDSWKRFYGSSDDESRYEQLYRVTAKFHSSMNMDDVLAEVINTLREVYPVFEYYLLLSHENKNHKGLPIKELRYGSDAVNPAASQAYLTGSVQFEDSLVDGRSVLYAPLKGKQGIYGVLQVVAPNSLVFPKQEVGFIELLANTAGNALENAQLYQQSKRLISDLQLINKTSHRLNLNLRLSETIKYMSEQIKTSFHAQEVGFVIFEKNGEYEVLQGSTDYFISEKSNEFLKVINQKIKREEDSLFIGDMKTDSDFSNEKFRSLMAVPMIQNGLLKGAVYVLHQESYYFTFESFKLLQSLIHHSTLAFTNSMLREELEKLVITDHLTKLYSRNYLDEQIHLSMKEDAYGSFLLIDIDDFKSINDSYGHQVGDEVIVQVAEIIKNNIREFDIGARWGGEELAVYLPRTDLEIGIKVAERLKKKVAEGTDPKITISCGVAFWSKERKDSVKQLFNRADEALYKAKENGKNQVVFCQKNF